MDIISGFLNTLKIIGQQCAGLTGWLTMEIANYEGISITPLTIITPTILIALLTYIIIRFFLI